MLNRKKRTSLDFKSLSQFLDSVSSYTSDMIFGIAPGQSLYHYTDLSGLQEIVSSHDLWLTHSRYSNDDEEITHGYKIVKEVIEDELKTAPAPVRMEFLQRVTELMKETTPEGVYICCFCNDDNLLSQWRGYGANGTGVSIRLNPLEFSYITGPDSPPVGLVRLWKVFYETDRQKNIVKQALDFAFFNNMNPLIEERSRQAVDAIQFFIPTFKHDGFREESECRLIFTPQPDCPIEPEFRVARGMLVPYYSLKQISSSTRMLPITGVRVGPSANKRMNVESAQMLLAKTGYTNVNVDSSGTPYRG